MPKPNFYKPRSSGGSNYKKDRPTEMHKTTCEQCKRGCEVPFKPTGSKPVLCKDCYGEKRFNSEPREFKGRQNEIKPPTTSADTRLLKTVKADLESLAIKVDSLIRNLKVVTDHIAKQESKTSLGDVMKDIGVKTDDIDSQNSA